MLLRIPGGAYLVAESLVKSLKARAGRGPVTAEAKPPELVRCSSLTTNSPVGGPVAYPAFHTCVSVRYGLDCNVSSATRFVKRCET